MTKRTTRRSKSTTTPKASQAKAAKPRSPAKRRGAAAKASAKPARRGRTAAARAQTRTAVAPKLIAKRRGTARGSSADQGSGDPGSGEQQTRALLALDPDESRFGESEASFHLEDSSEGADGLREELGESYVENATGADDAAMEHREVTTVGELGGPFVITSAGTEFADGVDASNPVGAEPAPLPMV